VHNRQPPPKSTVVYSSGGLNCIAATNLMHSAQGTSLFCSVTGSAPRQKYEGVCVRQHHCGHSWQGLHTGVCSSMKYVLQYIIHRSVSWPCLDAPVRLEAPALVKVVARDAHILGKFLRAHKEKANRCGVQGQQLKCRSKANSRSVEQTVECLAWTCMGNRCVCAAPADDRSLCACLAPF
jgi:hypothetical protein